MNTTFETVPSARFECPNFESTLAITPMLATAMDAPTKMLTKFVLHPFIQG